MKRQATTGGRKNRRRPSNLREQVDPLMCQAYAEARVEANGLWPTPRASDGAHGGPNQRDSRGNPALPGAVHMWPTPKANSYTGASNHGEGGQDIQTAVKMWPTPRGGEKGVGLCGGTGHLQMLQDGLGDKELVRKISAGNGGQLNADWVELLMGFPIGWTNLECDNPSDWQGWPAGMGAEQFDHEPPQVIEGQKKRAHRLKTLGNAVVPAQILQFFEAIGKLGGD